MVMGEYFVPLLDHMKKKPKRKAAFGAENSVVSLKQCNSSHIHVNDGKAKLNELFHHLHYSPDLLHSGYYLFPNLKKYPQRKRFTSNEGVKYETDAYFGAFEKSCYIKGIQILQDFCNKCIALGLERNYVER